MKIIFIFLIKGYQKIVSPFLGMRCRFHPSCSTYAIESIENHGVVFGIFYACNRLTKCHPFHAGGHDPVVLKKVNE